MKKLRFAVWSNAAFLAPLAFAAYAELWGVVAVLGALILFSILFHYSGERHWVLVDTLASYAAVAAAAGLVLQGSQEFWLMAALLVLVCGGLLIRHVVEKGRRGSTAHGVWHLIAATAFSVALFSYSSILQNYV